MAQPSKSRRRLLISLGLLGLTAVLYFPAQKLLEIQRGAKTWREKWQSPPQPGNEAGKRPVIEHASLVPTYIKNDLTLKMADSPWVVDGNVTIPAGVTLTIEAGSEIFIGRQHYFTVEGRLLASGTADSPIRIQAFSSAAADKWAGIFIIDTLEPSVFRHVEFENSYYGARLVHAAGTWTACSFMNVQEVCSAFKSETVFKSCLVDYKGIPAHTNINVFKFHKGSARMEGCSIHCPASDYKIDGIDADYLERGVFRGNRLYGGMSPNTDAIDVGHGSRNILIKDNIITDFVDKGISVGEGADVVIENNIIARCAIGVGVTNGAHARIAHTTFYGNDYAVKCYERDPGQGGGHAMVENSILADSPKAPFLADKKSSVRFINTLCDQQLLSGTGNLQGTPEFEDIGKDRFNFIKVTTTGGDSKTSHLINGSFGANIVPYPESLPVRDHA